MDIPLAARRATVVVAYALFVLVGLSAGFNGVLLRAQMDDYAVGQATLGITFFTGSAGFVLAGVTSGPLIHRWGTRWALLLGGLSFAAAGLVTATRPSFWVFVAVQLLAGYGTGLIESVLNAHLAAQPRSTTLLNRLHAFFGVGALLGPVVAAALLRVTEWPMVILVLTLVGVPGFIAAWLTYPSRAADPLAVASQAAQTSGDGESGSPLLPAVLRQPAVVLGAVLLSLYVGLELGVGNWGYVYMLDARSAPDLIAGWTISAYWFGLTLGRFVLSPLATRYGLTKIGLAYVCLFGVVAASALTWAAPVLALAAVGFVALGFFLGPIFPTAIAVAPDLTSPRLAPTAIGVMNAGSVVGGAALPWLAGALGQGVAVWTLLPFALILALAQLVVWSRMVARMDPSVAVARIPRQARREPPVPREAMAGSPDTVNQEGG
jgi:fucose permease